MRLLVRLPTAVFNEFMSVAIVDSQTLESWAFMNPDKSLNQFLDVPQAEMDGFADDDFGLFWINHKEFDSTGWG